MIIATREGRAVETRAFALTDMSRWGFAGLRNLQTPAGEKDARGIPALNRAARLRAEAVASLKLYCWRGEGADRLRTDTVWQSRLFSNGSRDDQTNEIQTRFAFWETVEESLAWFNNAFVWKNVAAGRIVDWWALHPAQVLPKYEGTKIWYEVQVSPGYVDPVGRGPGRYRVDASTILHIRGHGQGGKMIADPLVSVFREKMASVLGRQRHEARMWRRGVAGQLALEIPKGVSKEQADQIRESWRANYEGTESETTLVAAGGATIKPIGVTPVDAQFVELEHASVEDASRMMAVPANLLGAQITRPRPDLEQDLMAWLRFGLGPELSRIEDALYADPDLFGGAQTYPAFDTEHFVRGDLLTEATVLVASVQAGIRTPDEARRVLGLDDLPNGIGAIPQITPVGGAPNMLPALKPKAAKITGAGGDPDADTKALTLPSIELRVNQDMSALAEVLGGHVERVEQAEGALIGRLLANDQRARELESARESRMIRDEQERRQISSEMLGALEQVGSPHIEVHVPALAQPEVHVHVPEQPAPQVHIHEAPAEQLEIDFARDGYGLIAKATSTPKRRK